MNIYLFSLKKIGIRNGEHARNRKIKSDTRVRIVKRRTILIGWIHRNVLYASSKTARLVSVSRHILSKTTKPEHNYEHPLVFLTVSLYLSLGTFEHSYLIFSQNFGVQPLKSYCHSLLRTPEQIHSEQPVFCCISLNFVVKYTLSFSLCLKIVKRLFHWRS